MEISGNLTFALVAAVAGVEKETTATATTRKSQERTRNEEHEEAEISTSTLEENDTMMYFWTGNIL